MYDKVDQVYAKVYFKDGEQVFIQANDSLTAKGSGIMHRHDFIEIVYITSGSARHHMNDINYEVHKGDVVIVNYGVPHMFIPHEDVGEPFGTYDLLFTTELFEITDLDSNDFSSLASSYLFCSLFRGIEPLDNSLNLIRSGSSREFGYIFDKIYEEYTQRNNGFMNVIRAYLVLLITKIFREIDKKTLSVTTKEQREVVDKAIEYMKQNYNTPINLDSLVADIFLSKDYFRRLFKSTTGMSVTDFIQKTRIEKATKLLLTTNRSVFDISGECGFRDMTFFYKTFKKITGKTPGEYRKDGDISNNDSSE